MKYFYSCLENVHRCINNLTFFCWALNFCLIVLLLKRWNCPKRVSECVPLTGRHEDITALRGLTWTFQASCELLLIIKDFMVPKPGSSMQAGRAQRRTELLSFLPECCVNIWPAAAQDQQNNTGFTQQLVQTVNSPLSPSVYVVLSLVPELCGETAAPSSRFNAANI